MKKCDLAGARTQDPNIKSVVLYQLSYQVINKMKNKLLKSLVTRLGIEPRTPTLRVSCSTS